jgi:queuine tRNA-ribosyltransferase
VAKLIEMPGDYMIVELANGEKTLFSASYSEKMHPGLGPAAEAELLYVRQLNLRERLQTQTGEFVIWDVGLGAAANSVAALRATRDIPGTLKILSFDNTIEPLKFAFENAAELGYMAGYREQVDALVQEGKVEFKNGETIVSWEALIVDFPAWLERMALAKDNEAQERKPGKPESGSPHAIFFDAFSPAKNPAMWTLPVFRNLFRLLNPARPCALTTYSRSTLIRATLLLAGFYAGIGHATGLKEETTIAANSLDLIAEPLDTRWLERAGRSDCAEPMVTPDYQRLPISKDNLERLRHHAQF